MNRRRLLKSIAFTGVAAQAQTNTPSLGAISSAHGLPLSDERLGVLQPVLEQRMSQLRALRDFPIDDATEPFDGV